MTPFKAVYGRDATVIHDYIPGTTSMASIEQALLEHQRVITDLKSALSQARDKMIKQANKRRMDKEFQVGDLVYLQLQDFRQKTVHNRQNRKLSKWFYGPYKVIERIGKVAYKLQLPSTSKIHPVFRISLLKPSHEAVETDALPTEWPTYGDTNNYTPEAILQQRITTDSIKQVLVKWADIDLIEATWEDLQEFQLRFPDFPMDMRTMSGFRGRVLIPTQMQQSNMVSPWLVAGPREQSKSPSDFRLDSVTRLHGVA